MAEDLQTFTAKNVFADNANITSQKMKIKAAVGDIAPYTPLIYDSVSNYELKPATNLTDSDNIAGILVPVLGATNEALANSASTQYAQVYTGGTFFASVLAALPATVDTPEKINFFFRKTNLNFVQVPAGQD